MVTLTNRHAGYILLTLSLCLALYVVTSEWAFETMRDGTMIGSFPLAFIALCCAFAAMIALNENRTEVLEDTRELGLSGAARIVAFITGGLLLSFYHETLGFVGLCVIFLIMVGWFMGQRRPLSLIAYAVGVCAALFGLFTLLGFELTIAPTVIGV